MRRLIAVAAALAVLSTPVAAKSLDQRVRALEKRDAAQVRTIKKLTKRLKAVERKTSYFKTYRKAAKTAAANAPMAAGNVSETINAPNNASPFLAYVWVSGPVTYGDMSGGYLHYMIRSTNIASGDACQGNFEDLTGGGTIGVDAFCALTLSPGEDVRVTVQAIDDFGVIADSSIATNANFVEMLEP